MKLSMYLWGLTWSWEELRRAFRAAEALGFSCAYIMDNVVGPKPGPAEASVFDAWTVLPALSCETKTIRLGAMVTPVGRRHPSMFAKSVSVTDQISGGRISVGLGPGDEDRHFLPWGMEFPKPSVRIKRLCEDIQIMKQLWTREHTDFEGEFYHLEQAVNNPKPVQKPHPPIIIGLIFGRQLMPRLAAEFADGINIYIREDKNCVELFNLMGELCDEYGTDFERMSKSRCVGIHVNEKYKSADDYVAEQINASLHPEFAKHYYGIYEKAIVGSPDGIIEEIKEQEKLGFDELVINPANLFSDKSAEATIREMEIIAEKILPAFE